MSRKLTALLAACLCGTAGAADVYKWTDAGGVVHYADTEPPAEAMAQLMHVAGGGARASLSDNDDTDSSTQAGKKAPPPDTHLLALAGPEARCNQARAELELLQSNTPVGLPSAGGGQPQPLDAAGRRAKIDEEQSIIAHNCK